jgi:YjjG family noncanonical pyrimidine nucleotidase
MFVYFDLDGTLLDHEHAERKALADLRSQYLEIFGTLSVDELQEQYREINVPLWRRYAEGDLAKDTLKRQRFEDLLEAVGAPHADPALVGRYYLQRYGSHWQFIDGAQEAYEAIGEAHPVGILTNGFSEVQAEKLKEFPMLEERAETVVVCEENGALKPDPEAFRYAAQQAGVEAEDVLYVGDSYRSDVEGAQNAGWRVAWYAPDGPDGRSTDDRGFVFDDWSTLADRLT